MSKRFITLKDVEQQIGSGKIYLDTGDFTLIYEDVDEKSTSFFHKYERLNIVKFYV